MNHYLSTHLFVNHRLTVAMLSKIQQAGFPAVEIFCARQHLEYRNKAQVTELGHWFRDAQLRLHSMHSPMYNDEIWGRSGPHAVITITEPVKGRRIEMVDDIKRAIEVAEQLPFRYLIQHIGVPNESFSPKKFDATMTAIEHLKAFAKPLGVTVLVENIPNDLSTPERLLDLLHTAHFTDVHICFDFGHAHIMNQVYQDFDALRDRVRSTHIHDNARDRDAHLWPGEGTIDWKEAMELLQAAPNAPPLLMEIEGIDGQDLAAEMSKAYSKLEAVKV